jgi:HYR domain-containing protein/parallel beta helix pectate lyase-like protein
MVHGWRIGRSLAAAVAIAAAGAPAAHAQDLTATPANLSAVFGSAAPGDRILLASGDYGTFTGGLKDGTVTLTPAAGATASMAIEFNPASNVDIDGVTITDALIADARTKNITIENSTFDRSQAVVRTGELSNANIMLDHNLHVGYDKCGTCAEGRVELVDHNDDPSGVTIQNSVFAGGNSDGIQNGGSGVKILNNEFADIKQIDQDADGVHADAIQLYGSVDTVIKNNYFHGDADAIMAADGADGEVIENNVIGPTDSPVAITLYSDNGSLVRHNTIWDIGCSNDAYCGVLALGSKSGAPGGQDTTVLDNIVGDASASEGTATFAFMGFDFNLIGYGELVAGTNNFAGTPTFTGGETPTTLNGFALADSSAGKSAASDGQDVGAVGLPWTWAPGPATQADPPTIEPHTDLTFEATSPQGRVVDYVPPAAHDPGGGTLTPSCTPAPGFTFPVDAPDPTPVTCIATASGRTATTTFDVHVVDTTGPAITPPDDLTREATGPSGAVVSYPAATAHDLVDGDVPAVCGPASGSTFALGTTTVTCTATDAHDNTAAKSFVVHVVDTAGPVVTPRDDLTREATGPNGAVVSYPAATAHDLVDGAVAAACTPASGSSFALGTTTVTCTATDAHHNTAKTTFRVRVADTTRPSLAGMPSDLHVTAPAAEGARVTYHVPTAIDLVDGARPVTCTPASGSMFSVGTTKVTCAAGDRAGNQAVRQFNVIVDAPAKQPAGDPGPPGGGQPTGPGLEPGTLSVASARGSRSAVALTLLCPAGTSGCAPVTVRLTVSVRLKRGKVAGISRTTRTIAVGSRSTVTTSAGHTVQLRVKLNRNGRKLLQRFARMKVTVRVSTATTVVATRRITLKARKHHGH